MAYLRTKIQSTRSSQTSTSGALGYRISYFRISIHKVFADLDSVTPKQLYLLCNFNPRGLRRPRQTVLGKLYAAFLFQSTRSSQTSTISSKTPGVPFQFQSTRSSQTSTLHPAATGRPLPISIHEVFADLDSPMCLKYPRLTYFNPRGLRRPRLISFFCLCTPHNFNPRGLRRPRPFSSNSTRMFSRFQSTRSSQTSTKTARRSRTGNINFNPRGLRRPRLRRDAQYAGGHTFQSTRSSQTSTLTGMCYWRIWTNFNPRGLRRPRRYLPVQAGTVKQISIHEVFADLDEPEVRWPIR